MPTTQRKVTVRGRDFRVVDTIPAIVILKLARAQTANESMEVLAVVYDLLRAAVAPEDLAEFEKWLADPHDGHPIDVDELIAIVGEIMEAVVGRPFDQPSSSPALRPPVGTR
jgi:hypothetical protein